jgi:hypothetical protein
MSNNFINPTEKKIILVNKKRVKFVKIYPKKTYHKGVLLRQ